ncbi:cysteine--tRNA ligase [Brevibacterium album]|uniref:cysteine--tRNA ligase n=1 Tax=Brevibacterium album TaxID=417948 RepID=UPI000404733F|nr:cysteine--tRNA ligase [Brevibacterium album]
MTIRLHSTAARDLVPLTPVTDGEVGIYVCGATVQGAPHIGHMRSAVVFDQLRRWLLYRGLRVTLVRNVTDIDDKILAKSVEEGRTWWAHAYRYEQVFTSAYAALGVLPPTYEPRATGHITEMVELIGRLIAAGHAYAAEDGSGDVYFDVRSWPDYGALTHQSVDDMADAADADPRGKRDVRDFALWKGHKETEPDTASWPSPWGRGRPGWHIECSAMSTKYLGAQFDIHGGGLDLRFPHHENELAQSTAAGDAFANIWMHSGLLSVDGDKMSKSLGNSVFAHDLLERFPAAVLRHFLSTAHYRSVLEFSPELVERQRAAYERVSGFVERAREALVRAGLEVPVPQAAVGYDDRLVDVPEDFAIAMDEDLSIPRALASVFATVRTGTKLLTQLRQAESAVAGTSGAAAAGGDAEAAVLSRELFASAVGGEEGTDPSGSADVRILGLRLAHALAQTELMLDILGTNPTDPAWEGERGTAQASAAEGGRGGEVVSALVELLASRRAQAKADRDYETADAIRAQLREAGVLIEDTPDGYRYDLA